MNSQLTVDAVTALAWVATTYKLPALVRRPRDPATRSYWLALCLMALALTVLLPQTYVAIDRLLGRPNLARLLGDGLGLAAAWATQALLYYVTFPPDQARRKVARVGVAIAAALLVMACCFALAPVQEEALDFAGRYQHAPFIPQYRLVFLSALGLAIANFARLSWRYARGTDRPALGLGLRLVAVGGCIGLGYVANEVLRVSTALGGVPDPIANAGGVSQMLIATFIGVGLVGTTMPAWGPRVGIPEFAAWWARYQALHRLYPLWLALYRAHPEIALVPPRAQLVEALDARDVPFRLYRRVVEIRDGILYLRPSMDPSDADVARESCSMAGLTQDDVAAVVEAAVIAAALRRQALGMAVDAFPAPPVPAGGGDLASEVAALQRIARRLHRSPIVRAVVARLDQTTAPSSTRERAAR